MNFNPMDLILIKEYLYHVNSQEFDIISKFINKLLDIQNKGLPKEIREQMHDKGKYFNWKNKLIELALKSGK